MTSTSAPADARDVRRRHPRQPGADHRWRRRRPGPPPRRPRACGCARRSCSRRSSAASASRCTPACGWCCPPTPTSRTRRPASRAPPAAAAGPSRIRRLTDVGPAIALAALGLRRDPAARGGARPGRRVLAGLHRAGRHRPAVAPGRRGPARALARHHRPDRPDARRVRQRRLGGVRPGRRRRRPDHHRARAVLVPRRVGRDGPRHHRRRAADRRRPGDRGRPVGLPARLRPDRRARRAGAHPGARRPGRAPARLGAPDARPDPEERRRRRRPSPGWPASQERDLRSWLYVGESTDERTVASALRGVAAEVEDAHGVSVEVVTVGDCPMSEALRPVVHATREAVTNAAKHAGTGQVDVYAEITAARRRRVRPRPRPRLRPGRRRRGPVRRPQQHHRPDGPARRLAPTYAPRPARAPRCGCTFRRQQEENDG